MPESTLNTIIGAAPFWGPVAAILIIAVVALYKRGNALEDKLFEYAVKSIEKEAETKAALEKNAEAGKQIADAMNRIADKISVRT